MGQSRPRKSMRVVYLGFSPRLALSARSESKGDVAEAEGGGLLRRRVSFSAFVFFGANP